MLCFFFAGQKRGISDGKAKKPLRGLEEAEGRAKRASLKHQMSSAAERAATSARPDWPSEESCRNKCRREGRMLSFGI